MKAKETKWFDTDYDQSRIKNDLTIPRKSPDSDKFWDFGINRPKQD